MKLTNFFNFIINYTNNAFGQNVASSSVVDAVHSAKSTAIPSNNNKSNDNERIDRAVEKLQAAHTTKSLLKKHLTPALAKKLKCEKTSMGATLWDCIQSGVANVDSGVGMYAPDAEAYTTFADLFYPIIKDYHIGFDPTREKHPPADFGLDKVAQFQNLDPDGRYIISTRVRCGRSLQGYPFNPLLTEEQYKDMETKVSSTLSNLSGAHAGKYYPLKGMSHEVQQRLVDDHFLFKEGDRFLQQAQACRFWPAGRGIYHNDAKTFLVWVNEEDHLRIISMQKGGDLRDVYTRLVQGVQEIEKRLPFSRDGTLGFLTFCPTNLGTSIRASVHIKLPKISAREDEFKQIASKYNLQVRGTSGEHTKNVNGVYDVSNKRRLGLTEFEAVKEMYDGVQELIRVEEGL